jgi:5-formyltetrahydrofolate cyclo-ligase
VSKLPIETEKAALRQRLRQARAALPADERADASAAAARHLLTSGALKAGRVTAGYWPIRDELDCRPILLQLLEKGEAVALPVVQGPSEPLEWRLWLPDASLVPSGFGSLAPSDEAPRAEPEIMLLPLLGFDRVGTRLGYGGGYYDRSLASFRRRPLLIGLAFSQQELPAIPREAHDIPLDAVVTEAGLRYFGSL